MLEQGHQWAEIIPEPDEAVFNALIAICIRRDANWYEAVGTGFIVGPGGTFAQAFSAAHVFDHIYHRQNPQAVEKYTVFDALHPAPQRVDLDPENVFGMIFRNGCMHRVKLSDLIYERRSDFAMFKIAEVQPGTQPIFDHNISMDDVLPPAGTLIEGIGFKHMSFAPHMDGASLKVKFQAGLTRRRGTISAVHMDGHMRLKVPCVTATFPIFGGMSGGPVLKIGTGQRPAAFGILSSDYEAAVDEKYDFSQAGATNVAKLPLEWDVDGNGERNLTLRFVSEEIGTSVGSESWNL